MLSPHAEVIAERWLADNTRVQRDPRDDLYHFDVYANYDDRVSDEDLVRICTSENPTEAFDEWFFEETVSKSRHLESELCESLLTHLDDKGCIASPKDVYGWMSENISWDLGRQGYLSRKVNFVIALDTGDADTDFTECNILNWHSQYEGGDPASPIPEKSPIRFLARQQEKLEELEHLVRLHRDPGVSVIDGDAFSPFAKSVANELINAPSHMNAFVFLVRTTLDDYLYLSRQILDEAPDNGSWDYEDRKGVGEIVLGKDTACGLFDPWMGGGSLLDVCLEKDVVLPIKAIWRIWPDVRGCHAGGIGYDVCDVYGIDPAVYQETLLA